MLQDQIIKQALVVEDEPAISRVCQRVLIAEGFEVDIAMNGLIAMQMVNEKRYDICLSDIKMPLMGGIEFYSYLKKEHPDLARKVIFTTGDILNNNIEAFLKEVKLTFLAKPFTPDELIKVTRDTYGKAETGLFEGKQGYDRSKK